MSTKRRRVDAWVVVAAVAALVPSIALGAYWSRTEGLGLLDRFSGDASSQGAPAITGHVGVTIDATGAGRPISPLVYGVSFADGAVLKSLGATVDRWGGNTASTYNWVNHCWNAARDWEFRNKPADDADTFVGAALDAGAEPLVTIPTTGFVARDCNNATQSLAVPDRGGAPLSAGSAAIAGYDPARNRTAVYVPSAARRPANGQPADPRTVYQSDWVAHLTQRFAGAGGVRYYAMDNEPDAWAETHTDIHPVAMGYEDMVSNFEQYATAVKQQDPKAVVLGPDLCCWTTLSNSDRDRGTDNFTTHADRNAHGGQEFLPWWLQQVAAQDRKAGHRSLDLLDVHFYPQAAGVYSDDADPKTQALRIRSVRALDDSGYRDESWIGTPVNLIPRLQQWIQQDYPGTGLAITEYNFGGQKDASGAVALAEALGSFGRDGVNLATYWTYPSPDTPAGVAFRLYRNFDGAGATFGNQSLPAVTTNPAVRAFAARQSGRNEVDVVLVNESQSDSATIEVHLGGAGVKSVDEFRVAPGASQIVRAPVHGTRVTVAPLGLTLVRLALA